MFHSCGGPLIVLQEEKNAELSILYGLFYKKALTQKNARFQTHI